ncbi:WD40/YVTN/BNR-like repeat-containing protein [Noviherbaspirillum sedimenti]|uniref:Glycosyl hydrolase n=1 Tax=Noviherbaspirillum sedimenti TaxID=2320865 RepID=A0A3A3GK87_9BURK|nr:YCF48-related protein [Noviherbaspirillum sedimenti]RJG01370.1 glycosyl hydrolase [Noviherbaspirillum sedimenti]
MRISKLYLTLLLAFSACVLIAPGAKAESGRAFQDPLSMAATPVAGALKISKQPILALATVNKKIVAVGLRGLIALSDDGGKIWRQAKVPVQSDLTAVTFPNDRNGWAVGHDGVIIATSDAGETWVKQFDGNQAATLFPDYYRKQVEAGNEGKKAFLDQVTLNAQNGAALPYLAVHFANEKIGYAVGSFGMIVATEDGGKMWRPWLEHVENNDFLNLNDIQQVGTDLYMVGERGMVWKLDRSSMVFKSIATGYNGSFFGLTGSQDKLLAFGLAGTVYRSANRGLTWEPANIGTRATLTAGTVTGSGLPILVSERGQLFIGDSQWKTFQAHPIPNLSMLAAVAISGTDSVVVAGYGGIQVQSK